MVGYHNTSLRNSAAFALVELLAAVVVIAALAGGALMMISGSIRAAKEQKLVSDVATLNAALSTFLSNGGSLDGVETAAEVIERIKTESKADEADYQVGLRGGLLDPRITPVDQSVGEAKSAAPRVFFHATKRRFVAAYTGKVGVKEFVLDPALAAVFPRIHACLAVVENEL